MRGHPSIDLLSGLDHPGQAGLFPVWWEKMWFQGFVNLCSLCHYKSLASRTKLPPHQKQKKKWVESHPFSAGLLPLTLSEAFPRGQALPSPLQSRLNQHSEPGAAQDGSGTAKAELQPSVWGMRPGGSPPASGGGQSPVLTPELVLSPEALSS